jgi:2-dehydro-3-deoxyphosphogalactonate aldolase
MNTPTTNPIDQLAQALAACPLVAILRGLPVADAPAIGQAVYSAGFRIIEVPLNSPSPLRSIGLIASQHPSALVGAGTVLSVQDVESVKAAGGNLVISPHFNPLVVRRAVDLGMVCMPGVMTATEAFAALNAGAHALKIFPAEMASPAAIKALRAVLPRSAIVLPVGGITPDNMAAYCAAGADGFGIGSALYKLDQSAATTELNATQVIAAYDYIALTLGKKTMHQ